jgi:hypothetical protein
LNRKLLVLDIALVAAVIYGGFQLHSQWAAARARQSGMPGPAPKPAAVAAMAPLPQEPAVLPSGYKGIAVNTLFDPSRNPNIPVDPPPPPPPPKEPPPLPSYHGMMDFGDPQGPIALITESASPGHQEVHAGEMIGSFKLVSFNRQEMTLDWEGRVIHKRLNEGGSEPAKVKVSAVEPLTKNGVIPGQAPPQQEAVQPQTAQLGPGANVSDSVRACQPNDSTPTGTVVDGYTKIVRPSVVGGSQCFWMAAGK